MITYSLLLNIAVAVDAKDKEMLWKFITKYYPTATKQNSPKLYDLTKYVVQYYQDHLKQYKSYKTEITEEQLEPLLSLKETLIILPDVVYAEELQQIIYDIGKQYGYSNMKDWFILLYQILFGQSQGPRIGTFIEIYGVKNTLFLLDNRLEQVVVSKAK